MNNDIEETSIAAALAYLVRKGEVVLRIEHDPVRSPLAVAQFEDKETRLTSKVRMQYLELSEPELSIGKAILEVYAQFAAVEHSIEHSRGLTQ